MRDFHAIAALRGDGLRPELQALFDRVATDPRSELFTRDDGMVQAGPVRTPLPRQHRQASCPSSERLVSDREGVSRASWFAATSTASP
jgi:hypothetical protein